MIKTLVEKKLDVALHWCIICLNSASARSVKIKKYQFKLKLTK
jgi:hypothetical protein